MSITRLALLAAILFVAVQAPACSSRADARPERSQQPRDALVAPMPARDARPAPQGPFDERPVTPFETVGAS